MGRASRAAPDSAGTHPVGVLRWPAFPGADLPRREGRLSIGLIHAVAVTTLVVCVAYLLWRAGATLHGATWWLATPLLLLEAHAVVSLLFHTIDMWDPHAIPPPPPVHDSPHRIAVLIPTYNEPREVLLPAVAAAVALAPAHETWVLDDGRRPWVAELAAALGARYRTREDTAHAKAGNLNAVLPNLDVDLVAVLDADHVVAADFLADLLGYFDDPRVALVQTPQDFYNLDSFEHVLRPRGRRFAEQELFYRGLAAGRNRWNAAFWCGTNAVLRLSALRRVGGVAVETVTEDIHTTIRLHRAGFRTVHHNAVLARGLAAANSEQYLNQRLRWGTGAMQVLRVENPAVVSGLRLPQRLSYLSTLLGWFDAWRTLGYVLLPVGTVLVGGLPIAAPLGTFLGWFGAAFLLQRLSLRLLARGRAPVWQSTTFEFIRLPANLQATTALFSRRPRSFSVTAKGGGADRRSRMPVPRLLLALLVVSAFAAGWYAATALGLTPLRYRQPWVAHGAALWLVVNGAFLVAAVRRIRGVRFGAERRAAVRFDLDGWAWIDGTHAELRDVSLTGLRAVTRADLVEGDTVAVTLPVSRPPLVLPAVVRTVRAVQDGHEVGLEFAHPGVPELAALALALFRTGIQPRLVPAGSSVPRPRPSERPANVA